MGLFSKHDEGSASAEAAAHPAPVEIDLGLRKVFEVQMVVAQLESEGCHLYLVDQSEIAKASELYPKHCRVLVATQDEARVREVFAEAGFL